MILTHADIHIEDIAKRYMLQEQWHGDMTVIRPTDGEEYAWPRLLSEREIRVMTEHFSGQAWAPGGVPRSGVFDIYRENGTWKARIGMFGYSR